jgi:hypothetical protein
MLKLRAQLCSVWVCGGARCRFAQAGMFLPHSHSARRIAWLTVTVSRLQDG